MKHENKVFQQKDEKEKNRWNIESFYFIFSGYFKALFPRQLQQL